jgi:2'-5' RNA ligase
MNHHPDWYQLGLTEYFLIADPSQTVFEKVMALKWEFFHKYRTMIAVKTDPYITIANFLLKDRMEGILCRGIQNVCNVQCSFYVGLKNFAGFRNHAIYICVQNQQPFKKLAENLKRLNDVIETAPKYPTIFVDKAHMTIARQLDAETYSRAIQEYTQYKFQELFLLEKLTLLKRDSYCEKWKKVSDFPLPKERDLFH